VVTQSAKSGFHAAQQNANHQEGLNKFRFNNWNDVVGIAVIASLIGAAARRRPYPVNAKPIKVEGDAPFFE